jgi:type IV pilus assembly protein PilV
MVNSRSVASGFGSGVWVGRQGGISLIEVLVTIVILAIGLLGLAGLQSRLQVSEMEAYQRAQALILINDMANRLASNRAQAGSYVTSSPVGVNVSDCSGLAVPDLAVWCDMLKGAAEVISGDNVGAMVGGRGCVEAIGANTYMVTVAWQGLTAISAPAPTCGEGAYDTAGTSCVNDRCRRAITTIVRLGDLS